MRMFVGMNASMQICKATHTHSERTLVHTHIHPRPPNCDTDLTTSYQSPDTYLLPTVAARKFPHAPTYRVSHFPIILIVVIIIIIVHTVTIHHLHRHFLLICCLPLLLVPLAFEARVGRVVVNRLLRLRLSLRLVVS